MLAMLWPVGAQPAQAYTWGPWSPGVYVSMQTTAECTMAKRAYAKFIGPLTDPGIGCRHKIRFRKGAVIAGKPAPWIDQPIQLQDIGGFSLYGMTLTTVVRYNGSFAVVDAQPTCSHWANLITVKQTRCAAVGSWTSLVTLQLDYEVSFGVEGFGFQRTRGAQQSVSRTGWISAVDYYHG